MQHVTSIRLDPKTRDLIRKHAAINHRSMSQEIRFLVEQYFDKKISSGTTPGKNKRQSKTNKEKAYGSPDRTR